MTKIGLFILIILFGINTPIFAAPNTEPAPNTAHTSRHQGYIHGFSTQTHTFFLQQGQRFDAQLKSRAPYAYFNVYVPNDRHQALFIGASAGETFHTIASETGEYTITIYQMRASARRGKTVSFTLNVSIH